MNKVDNEKRIQQIRNKLKVGDISHIAKIAGVHRVWVSYVLSGKGTSDRVLCLAEQYISNADNSRN